MSIGNVIQELVIRIRYVVDNGGLERANSAVSQLKRMVGGFAIGTGLFRVGKVALQTAAQLESAQAQFETMLGSKAAADKMMNEMWEYAAMSTFEMSHVTHAATTMLNYGLSQQQTGEYMKRLGDIAGDSAPKFQRLALAFAQMYGKGRLTGEELRQFVNAGANPLRTVADMYFSKDSKAHKELTDAEKKLGGKNVTTGDLGAAEEAMRKRKVSAEMVMEAIKKLTDEGGRFYQNQLRQSKTLTGVYTTMLDRLKIAMSKAVMAISEPLKELMRGIGLLDFSPVIDSFRALATVISIVRTVVAHFANMFGGGGGLAKAWATFVATAREMFASEEFKQFAIVFGEMVFGLLAILYVAARVMLTAWILWMRGFMLIWRVIMWIRGFIGLLVNSIMRIPEAFGPVFAAITEFVGLLLDLFSPWVTAFQWIMDFAKSAWDFIVGILLWVDRLPTTFDAWVNSFNPLANLDASIDSFFVNLAERLTKAFSTTFDWITNKIIGITSFMMGMLGTVGNWIDEKTGLITGGKTVISSASLGVKNFVRDFRGELANVGGIASTSLGGTSLADMLNAQTKDAQGVVAKTVSGTAKAANVSLKSEFNVAVKGDPGAKTGLTAADVALLAERASRATFSLELERVLETVY